MIHFSKKPNLPFCTQAENTNLSVSITVQLTSCIFCFDSAALLMLIEQQFHLFGQIKNSQTRGQLYSDTSPYGECSLTQVSL